MNTEVFAPPMAQPEIDDEARTDSASLFTLNARIGRLRYMTYLSVVHMVLLLTSAVFVLGSIFRPIEDSAALLAVMFSVSAGSVIFSLMFTVQRLHDFNASGWWVLAAVIPPAWLVFLLVPGTVEPNRFGERAPTNRWYHYVAGLALPALAVPGLGVLSVVPALASPMM